MTLIEKTNRLLGELALPSPYAVRIVGSQALRAAQSSSSTPGSDIDLHIVVRNLDFSEYPGLFGLPKSLRLEGGKVTLMGRSYEGCDILAVKIEYMGELFSIHIYPFELFRAICRFAPRRIRILRNTKYSKTEFTGYGLRDTRPFYLNAKPFKHGLYMAEYTHKPIVQGRLYMFPYQSMAISGLTLLDGIGIEKERERYMCSIISHLRQKEGISDIADFNHIFQSHIHTINRSTLDSYNDLFLSEAANA